jgi:nickel-dependent lactate racemase
MQLAESRPLTAAERSSAIIPAGAARLADLARPGMTVTIAFTDATRACPDALLVGSLLRELAEFGVAQHDITLLCATGLHRPSTHEERVAKLGPEIASAYRIIDHTALDPAELVDLGAIDGLPVVVNRRCVEADLLLATGVVEPHQYAGYSGGSKTAVIGCGGEATIKATHGPEMLDRPGTRLGAIDGNPFQQFVRAAGARIGIDYVVNALMSEAGEIIAIAAGAPNDVHDTLVARARGIYEVAVERPAHIAYAGVDGPKAANLYQASRAATYLALAGDTPLLPGAPILLPAPIPEGAGQGAGEQRFYEILAGAESPATLIAELRRTGFPAGAQRAYILAQVLVNHPVIVVGAEHPEIVRACHMHAVDDIAAGIALAERLARAAFELPHPATLDMLVVPHALLALPRIVAG